MVKLLTMLKASRMNASQLIAAAKYAHRLAQRVRAIDASGRRARLVAAAGKDSYNLATDLGVAAKTKFELAATEAQYEGHQALMKAVKAAPALEDALRSVKQAAWARVVMSTTSKLVGVIDGDLEINVIGDAIPTMQHVLKKAAKKLGLKKVAKGLALMLARLKTVHINEKKSRKAQQQADLLKTEEAEAGDVGDVLAMAAKLELKLKKAKWPEGAAEMSRLRHGLNKGDMTPAALLRVAKRIEELAGTYKDHAGKAMVGKLDVQMKKVAKRLRAAAAAEHGVEKEEAEDEDEDEDEDESEHHD